MGQNVVDIREVVNNRRRRHEGQCCEVCGDKAHSIHYGALTCESCKGFFRRSVQRGIYSDFVCINKDNCTISASDTSRRKCQSCRFAKCRSVGMELKWVMTNSERKKLYEKRLEKQRRQRLQLTRPPDPPVLETFTRRRGPDRDAMRMLLSDEELESMSAVCANIIKVGSQLSHQDMEQNIAREVYHAPHMTHIALCMGSHMRAINFAHMLPDFLNLSTDDRDSLLHQNTTRMALLRIFYGYDLRRGIWPSDQPAIAEDETTDSFSCPSVITMDSWSDKVSAVFLSKAIQIMHKIIDLEVDEPCLMFLMIVLLFGAAEGSVVEKRTVERTQERFMSILHKYATWRYRGNQSYFPKLLSLIVDLEEFIHIQTAEHHIWLEDYEVEYFRKKMGKFNPFESYSTQKRNNEFHSASRDPYGVMHDRMPTVDMLHRCLEDAASSGSEKSSSPMQPVFDFEIPSTDDGSNDSDFHSLIENLDPASVDSDSMLDLDDLVNSLNQQTTPSWSPADFDLGFV